MGDLGILTKQVQSQAKRLQDEGYIPPFHVLIVSPAGSAVYCRLRRGLQTSPGELDVEVLMSHGEGWPLPVHELWVDRNGAADTVCIPGPGKPEGEVLHWFNPVPRGGGWVGSE
jgi:hypothetical protein